MQTLMVEHWTCPYCNHDAVIRDNDRVFGNAVFGIGNPAEGHKVLIWQYTLCPNEKCRKFELLSTIAATEFNRSRGSWMTGKTERKWRLIPSSRAKAFPDFVPQPIIDDYNEACLIADLSPKASATLSRRCLQGIIRDFWKVKTGRLVDEIAQIKDRTDPLTWDAIESVRMVGNIGAHMEKDINVLIDVDPEEAQMLIELIEILVKDWYVTRAERQERLLGIKSIAVDKKAQKTVKALPSTENSPVS